MIQAYHDDVEPRIIDQHKYVQPSMWTHTGIGMQELDRIKEKIFIQVRNQLEMESKWPETHYEPLKIAQDPSSQMC